MIILLQTIRYLFVVVPTVNGSVFISSFVSFAGIPIKIRSSTITTKIFMITAGIKICKSIIKKKHNKEKNECYGSLNF